MSLSLGEASVWADTNTMLEVYSHGDVFDAAELHLPVKFEFRRRRMQGALWMAMALAQQQVTTVSYQHENLNNTLRLGPPGSPRGVWTAAVLYILGDGGVFDGWERHVTNHGAELSNRKRDKLITELCVEHRLTLITRDGLLHRESIERGVPTFTPERYAARVVKMPRDWARHMFLARMRQAVDEYPSRYPAHERDQRAAAGEAAMDVYERVWQGPVTTSPWSLTEAGPQ
jgi:hypothetical protein